jgi:cell division protein ZapA (FtsZ GTPase activity inhibitor)
MREMPQPQQTERPRDPIEGLIDTRKLSILPESRQRVIRQLLDCFRRLKEGKATNEDEEFIRSIFSTMGGVAQEIQESIILDFRQYGRPQLSETAEKLNQALNDLYLLLLTSLPAEELDEKIQREFMRIKTSDFERIMQIWETKPLGIKFSYRVDNNQISQPQAMEATTEIKGEQQEARIESDKGFLYVFKPDHNFWRNLFLLGREEKEAEFNRILTEAILRFRQLSERLCRIKLPKEIKEILLEEDENKRNEKINQLSEEDKALVMMILNIQRNFSETLKKIKGIESHVKEFSAEDLEKLNQELRNLKKEADDYEEAIKKLEERFGTTYQPDNELAKKFLKKTSQWIKENLPTIGLTLGASLVLWGVALGWFLPLWLINKMKDEIEKGLK